MKPFFRILTFILISSGIFSTSIQKLSAQIIQDNRKVGNFENIVVSTTLNTYVHISYDKSPKVIVKADGRYLHKIRTTVSGETLTVHLNPEELGDARIEIYIRTTKIKRVNIGGSGRVDIIDGLYPGMLQACAVGPVGVSLLTSDAPRG